MGFFVQTEVSKDASLLGIGRWLGRPVEDVPLLMGQNGRDFTRIGEVGIKPDGAAVRIGSVSPSTREPLLGAGVYQGYRRRRRALAEQVQSFDDRKRRNPGISRGQGEHDRRENMNHKGILLKRLCKSKVHKTRYTENQGVMCEYLTKDVFEAWAKHFDGRLNEAL